MEGETQALMVVAVQVHMEVDLQPQVEPQHHNWLQGEPKELFKQDVVLILKLQAHGWLMIVSIPFLIIYKDFQTHFSHTLYTIL